MSLVSPRLKLRPESIRHGIEQFIVTTPVKRHHPNQVSLRLSRPEVSVAVGTHHHPSQVCGLESMLGKVCPELMLSLYTYDATDEFWLINVIIRYFPNGCGRHSSFGVHKLDGQQGHGGHWHNEYAEDFLTWLAFLTCWTI